MDLNEPKDFEVVSSSGKTVKVILSKIPAIAGREIVTQYPVTGAPKIGNYEENQKLMIKLLSYVAIRSGDVQIRLSSEDLINNHLPNAEVLLRVEKEMLAYNFDFFPLGEISSSLKTITQNAPEWITKTLTDLLPQLLQAVKQPSESSKPSTH